MTHARTDKSDPNGDVLDRLEFVAGPWRDYKLVDDVKAEITRLREALSERGRIENQIIAKQTALIAELSFRMEHMKLKPTPREIELTDALHDLYDAECQLALKRS